MKKRVWTFIVYFSYYHHKNGIFLSNWNENWYPDLVNNVDFKYHIFATSYYYSSLQERRTCHSKTFDIEILAAILRVWRSYSANLIMNFISPIIILLHAKISCSGIFCSRFYQYLNVGHILSTAKVECCSDFLYICFISLFIMT